MNLKKRYFFHRLFPRLDRWLHPRESQLDRILRHVCIEHPELADRIRANHEAELREFMGRFGYVRSGKTWAKRP